MTSKAALWQGLLALIGLMAAYLTWQREPSPDAGQVVVIDTTQRQLQKIRFEDGDTWVELTPGKDDAGDFVWLTLSGKKGSHMRMPSSHPVVAVDTPDRTLRGNASADKTWSSFAPLTASRALGTMAPEVLKELGFETNDKKLLVTFAGITRTFAVAPPPPGATDPYIRAQDDGNVFVIDHQILTDLRAARSNMVERRYHPFRIQDIDKIDISVDGKKTEFVFRRNDGTAGGDLIPAGASSPNETATNWHARIFGLFPADVMGKGEAPGGGQPRTVIRLDYGYRGKSVGYMELARNGDDSDADVPADPNAPPRSVALARSEFTAGWTKLSLDAQALLNEGIGLFGPDKQAKDKPADAPAPAVAPQPSQAPTGATPAGTN